MKPFEALVASWQQTLQHTTRTRAFCLATSGQLTAGQYAAMLRQIFHHARENPQLQALVTARFRGPQRGLVRAFLKHATAEVGHDELARSDIAALGFDVDQIAHERPLPATFALLASAFHMVEHHGPIAYLGYLFQLEYTPTQLGPRYMEALAACGIPREAMAFLAEHSQVDVAHCKLLERYCDELIRTPEDLEAALYMQRLTAELYARMLDAAIDSAEPGAAGSPRPTSSGAMVMALR